MTMNDLTGYEQTDTKTWKCLFAFAFYTIKTFKDSLVILFIDADPVVPHPDSSKFCIALNIDVDTVGIRRILDSVCQKIHDHLGNTILVCSNLSLKLIVHNNSVL